MMLDKLLQISDAQFASAGMPRAYCGQIKGGDLGRVTRPELNIVLRMVVVA